MLRIDPVVHTATQMPSLGVFQNAISTDAVAVTSANAAKVLIAGSDGYIFLYDANVDTFTVSRQDAKGLSGAYAASPFDQFVVGNNLLNSSLVTVNQFESATGTTSGFVFLDQGGFRTTAPDAVSAGIIQRVDLASAAGIRPTRMVEAPLLKTAAGATNTSNFTRTLAAVQNRSSLIALTVSGFTVLPFTYDTSVAPPRISSVVSAADNHSPAAPGGSGFDLWEPTEPTNLATRELPVPTALGDSCLTVNGQPMPMIFVSPSQINAQVPFQAIGNVTMMVHTPGGVSDNFNLTIQPNAPAVFRSGVAGTETGLPTLIRASNNFLVTDSNPVHRSDTLVIYLTGMGQTTPVVESGMPSPADPLATTLTQPVVKLGGTTLPVDYAGLAPGQVGVYQLNVTVPRSAPQGLQRSADDYAGQLAAQLRRARCGLEETGIQHEDHSSTNFDDYPRGTRYFCPEVGSWYCRWRRIL